jgi:hypothetical protein
MLTGMQAVIGGLATFEFDQVSNVGQVRTGTFMIGRSISRGNHGFILKGFPDTPFGGASFRLQVQQFVPAEGL